MKNLGLPDAFTAEKSYKAAGTAMPTSVVTRVSSAPTVIATHEPNDTPAAQSGTPGNLRRHEVEAGAEVGQLALAPGELAVAHADAAEIESQHRASQPAERLGRLEHDLRVHRPAVLRVRVRQDDRRGRACPR